jgi:phasin family protein
MFLNLENFSTASKAQLESQFETANALAHKAVAAGEKTISLNTAAAKLYFEESSAAVKEMFSLKDPQAFFALVAAQGKHNADKAAAYTRQLAETATGINAEFTQATEAHLAASKSKVVAMIDEVTKSAPAGSEKAVEMFKSVIGSANASYDQLSKSAKQAVQLSDTAKKVA